MATSVATLKFFYEMGERRGASHMIIAYDGWEDYPIYVMPGQNPHNLVPAGQRAMECYKYSLGWAAQSVEPRANHWEMDA